MSGGDNYYEVEVAIPLTALGLVPREGMVLRLDTGVLCTDKGKKTTDRYYWADKMAVGLPDEATETRLRPSLWGFIRFAGRKKTQLEQILDAQLVDRPGRVHVLDGFGLGGRGHHVRALGRSNRHRASAVTRLGREVNGGRRRPALR